MATIVRPVKPSDLESLYELALGAGFGITTLPKNEAELALRIKRSEGSFTKQISQPLDENYLFVLVDVDSDRVIGTSAIEAAVGYALPFYAYRVSTISKVCLSLDIRLEYGLLTLNNDLHGVTELATLYLDPEWRGNKNGLLLSKSRFLFMAMQPQRFSQQIIAEMRGVSDDTGRSPFWESFGRHFFGMSFSRADELSVLTDKQFISDLMPHHPIHVNLLTEEAQQAIGQPHETTKPAMHILQREGFNYHHYVDIFDAGPTIHANRQHIQTIKNAKQRPCCRVDTLESGASMLLSNLSLDYRATYASAKIESEQVLLTASTMESLQLKNGDCVQFVEGV